VNKKTDDEICNILFSVFWQTDDEICQTDDEI
jgi:hypothetical protein